MRLVFSSYDFASFAMTASKEKHPSWVVNPAMLDVLLHGCEEIDRDFKTGSYNLKADVDDNGNVIITLVDIQYGDKFRTWIMEEVFIIE